MKRLLIIAILLVLSKLIFAQYTQNVRGVVSDRLTRITLPGASIALVQGDELKGTTSNQTGEFIFIEIPIGRYEVMVSFMGYEPVYLRNVEVSSGKQTVLNIELVEQVIAVDEITVLARQNGEIINKMAALSARSFSVRETERYAGSLGDPSRMAANFAGVITANDSRNDIIIRGNSPQGLLWRLEGVSIPNPNHFGALGSTGGPVSMLNNNLLTNSDFFTGAFPAEYGNALAGVFDLRMRNGNNQKHEFVGQIGYNGFELGAEGPISRKRGSSYMVNYRYSVPGLMGRLGLNNAGTAIPDYQDLTLKFNLPTKNAGTFSLFGIAGDSNIEFDDSETDGSTYDTFAGTITKNGSRMGVVGLTHRFFPDEHSNILTTVSSSYQGVQTSIDSITQNRGNVIFFGEQNSNTTYAASTKYTRRVSSRNTFKAGTELQTFNINYRDSVIGEVFNPHVAGYVSQLRTKEDFLTLLNAYSEWQHRVNNNLTLYGGLYAQHFFFNGSTVFDPRASISYRFDNSGKVSLAYGKHSQVQPFYVYFTEEFNRDNNTYKQTNTNLGFSKAHHLVTGYDQMLTANLMLKIEAYYQHLFDIPITESLGFFSLVNSGASFHQWRVNNLVNEGLGRNFGTEITLEKYLDNNYYYMVNASLFDSKYLPSDGVWRNTEFNTNYVVNALGGYEIRISERAAIDINTRVTWSGGKRDLFIDLDRSIEAGETVYDHSKAYSDRRKQYFRLDTRASFKLNGKRITQEWALDITNLTGHQNLYSGFYDEKSQSINEIYQQGMFPMFLYRVNF